MAHYSMSTLLPHRGRSACYYYGPVEQTALTSIISPVVGSANNVQRLYKILP